MTPEDDLPRLPTMDELREKFEKPLDPDLEYFDATPSIEQLTKISKMLYDRVVMLEHLLQLQGRINAQMLDRLADLQKPKSALLAPERLN